MFTIREEDYEGSSRILVHETICRAPLRYPDGLSSEIVSRIEKELRTIIKMGFPDYFLIVMDFLNFGRAVGHMPDERMEYLKSHAADMSVSEMVSYVMEDQSFPGFTIGPGRGSAAGSIVCYILGITDIDPMEHGLLFERFLNEERVSMPDIDSDLSKSEFEYGVRDIVILYMTKKYGENAVSGIVTPSTLAPRGAVESMARIAGSKRIWEMIRQNPEKYQGAKVKTGKGGQSAVPEFETVRKQYLKYRDEIEREIPTGTNISFSMPDPKDDGRTLKDALLDTFKNRPELLEILNMAFLAEGLNVNFGMHACGKIIFPGDIREAAPLMYNTKAAIWNIQMDAEQAESAGFLKMDFLGLKTLNVITKTLRLVCQNTGNSIDCVKIPEDADVYREVFAKARTRAVFQFESGGMRDMLKRFRPLKFSDLILLVACYRPGPMQYLDGIIDRKNGTHSKDTESVLPLIPGIQEIIEPTYGAIVYQEQVQQIFRKLAGYSLGQADLVRRAMGHKKQDVLDAEKEAFIHGDKERKIMGCEANGVPAEYAEQLFAEMSDFAKYAFNKSHAAAYAQIAYITAWLKFHYPAEFYAGVLSCEELKKYPGIFQEAKGFGVHVLPPDIRMYYKGFYGSGNEIRYSLSGIKGIKNGIQGEMRTFSLADFMLNNQLGDKVITLLCDAGALDLFGGRNAIRLVLPELFRHRKAIAGAKKDIALWREMIADLDAGEELDREKWKIKTKRIPTREELLEKIKKREEKIEAETKAAEAVTVPEGIPESTAEDLEVEKELLGMYVSGHPLDLYGSQESQGAVPVSEADESTTRLCGIIRNYRKAHVKKDGSEICFFDLEDQSGTMGVCCFAKSYQATCAAALKDGDVVLLSGKVRKKDKYQQPDNEEYQFYTGTSKYDIIRCRKQERYCIVEMEGIEKWNETAKVLGKYQDQEGNGFRVLIHNGTTGEIEQTSMIVSGTLWTEPGLRVTEYYVK